MLVHRVHVPKTLKNKDMGKSLIIIQLLENKTTFLMFYFVLLWYGNGHLLLWDIYRIVMQYGIYVRFFSNIRKESRFHRSILYKSGNPITLCHDLPLDSRPECQPAQIGLLLAFLVVQLMVFATCQN